MLIIRRGRLVKMKLDAYFQPSPIELGDDLQGVNSVASTFNRKMLPAMQRRTAIRVAAGGALSLVLVACGGGGGDSSSGGAQALRDAFSKLHSGMTMAQVEALVGFPANDLNSGSDLRWIVDGVTLFVAFFATDGKLIYDAKLTEADGVTVQRRSFV